MSDDLLNAIQVIDDHVQNARTGLGDEVFQLVSRLTPLVNVDLLIKNEEGHILLTWRDDEFYDQGWHIPGGIVRYKETFENRLKEVAHKELGVDILIHPEMLKIQPVCNPNRDIRGHFVSFLYACDLQSPLDQSRKFRPENPKSDQWAWHKTMPDNLIKVHKMLYADVFNDRGINT